MKYILKLINRYFLQNDLYDIVSFIGGDNVKCIVKMPVNTELYRFISKMQKYTNAKITLRLNKSKGEGIVTFRKEVA
jgi:Zn-dependent M16 (insulinase) family peptidase